MIHICYILAKYNKSKSMHDIKNFRHRATFVKEKNDRAQQGFRCYMLANIEDVTYVT